ncbi:hypothetical protein I3843_05G215400 [Carya illinoinensis]|nr:hypothetical protein I3843_05G215400 [Carya illinoinensis]
MASVSKSSVFFLLSYLVLLCSAKDEDKECTKEFDCGILGKLHYPFFSNTENPDCGLFIKDCETNTPKIQLACSGSYEVVNFSWPDVIGIKGQLLPGKCKSLTNSNLPSFPSYLKIPKLNQTLYICERNRKANNISLLIASFKNLSCNNEYEIWYNLSLESLPDASNCSIIPPQRYDDDWLKPFRIVLHVVWSAGFDQCRKCQEGGGNCQDRNGSVQCVKEKKHKWVIPLVILSIGIGVLTVVIIYCLRRKFPYFWKKESVSHQNIEDFLKSFGPLTIRRYSYSDIKKMTNFSKEKLGQGGYGGVYKGKLQDGCLVAVKVLKESRANGEEFINEVASISRTSHVNIVTLMGFCFEGSKRALIYEFMPNGSLEKFIFKKYCSKDDYQLDWETLYKIAVGIARGLEYLHRGCNARILHFDIKPHNILLDRNYNPKISDFGLAKICSRDESIISMLGTRGTAGYIAPEVFSRNFGGISHKSDVYSYGMMVLEMVGGRKNIDSEVDCTSEIYFPHWVYKRLELDEELSLQGIEMNEEDRESVKKMIIVGLWCIQTDPSNRPAMGRVVDMLERSSEYLQIPPKPFLSSPSRSPQTKFPFDSSTTMNVLQVESI